MNNELTWEDIRAIVMAADMELAHHTKKELLEMGEEQYYRNVLDDYMMIKHDAVGVR